MTWSLWISNGGKVTAADIADLQVKVGSRGDSGDTYQETDVLFKRDGAWTIVSLPYSPAPKKGQP